MDKYGFINLIIKTVLWLAAGIGKGGIAEGDELAALYYELGKVEIREQNS